MGKIRVYELAKELETESKKLVDQIIAMGIDVKNHMSTLEDDQVAKIRGHFAKPAQPVKEAPKAVEEPKVKPQVDGKHKATSQAQGQTGNNQGRPQPTQHQARPTGQQDANKPEKIRIPMKARFEQNDNKNRYQHQNPNQQQRPQQGQQQQQRPNQQQRPQQGQQQQQRPPYQQQRPQQGQQQRPQGQQQRPQGQQQRPQGQQQRPQGQQQRPQGQQQRPQGQQQRPQGQQQRPQGQQQRPQGQQQRPQGQQGQQQRPQQNYNQHRQQAPQMPKVEANNMPTKQVDAHKIDHKPETKPANVHNRMGKKEREEQKLLEKKGFNKSKNKKDDRNQIQPEEPKEKAPAKVKTIKIGESISVQDLAQKMNLNAAELIKKLIGLGVMATINQEIDSDTAVILAGEFGFEVEIRIENLEEEIDQLLDTEDAPETLQARPAVVTVMGHVDHGKTSLLDAIRQANVIASEAGGITQHIGAYQVEHNNKKITFLDTPGHAAFTAMRARGAQVTDVSVLVVAADDGVMPQTIEAINHSKAANVPVIVAINKMDKPGANPERVKQELTEQGLVPEEWGGETICVPVSAKTKEGLTNLLEMILLVAEVSDLKANPSRSAKGTVIEAQLDKGRGSVATVLVQTGTLNVGDPIVAGTAFGRVRAMMDYKGRRVKKAGPSMPVEVLGLSDVPQAGDTFYAVDDEKLARSIATKRVNKKREEEMKHTARVSLDDLFKQIQEGQVKDLNIIIKADVQGSIEALKSSLEKLSTSEVRVNPIHGGVGAITETDIMLASASNAIILGFNVRPDANAKKAAEAEKVDMRLYRVIYNAIEDVKAAMTGLLDPEFKEVVIGTLEVRQIFKVSKVGTIAGCYVTDGKITKNAEIRLIRDGIVLHEGKIDALKRFKDDAKEVAQGFECGVTIENYNDINEGDVIEAFIFEEVARHL